ncbi:AMP-binding protein [Streptomyces lydicus]|nr:AMP-binding protein [Streptomyces lydicus]
MIVNAQETSEPRTYVDRILEHWNTDEDAEALVQGTQRLTRGEARRQLFRLGHALRGQGLAPGDGVGLFLANRVDSVLVQLAVHLIGCRVVFLPPEPGPGELAALVERSRRAPWSPTRSSRNGPPTRPAAASTPRTAQPRPL